jgi:hypothetical protein
MNVGNRRSKDKRDHCERRFYTMIRANIAVATFFISAALTTTWAKEKPVPHDAAWVD